MTDCIQCREWELCPFHPKEKPSPARDDEWVQARSVTTDTHRWCPIQRNWVREPVPVESECDAYLKRFEHSIEAWAKMVWAGNASNTSKLTQKDVKQVSTCGHYLQTWRDGKLVDEEPYEPADVSDDTADAIMYGLVGVSTMHTTNGPIVLGGGGGGSGSAGGHGEVVVYAYFGGGGGSAGGPSGITSSTGTNGRSPGHEQRNDAGSAELPRTGG